MRAFLNRSVAVLGTGSYLPDRVVTNDILRDWCTNYDDSSGDFSTWVDRVTHIHERRFIADGETAGHMAAKAAERALDMAGLKPTDLDLIIHASFTPSAVVPGDHVLVADLLGANKTPSFTLNVACSGSIYALATAYGMIASKAMRRILVTGSETISPVLDYRGMAPPYMGFDFNWENITMANANLPFTGKVVVPAANGNPPAMEKTFLTMISGPKVMRSAVNAMANSVRRVLGYDEGALPDDVRARMRVIPHQANGRIVDGLAKKLKVDPLKVTKTIYKVGNISAASNVIALDYAMRHGNLTADRDPETERILAICEVEDPIQRGELVVLPSIGAGYLFGAVAFVNTI
ncbi:MAG: 3-oxoacyl-ACP synthase III family protein [Planctomycetota bacterium]|jgi:3-oxoacyl-[acyl-carrier-protein] synthase-3